MGSFAFFLLYGVADGTDRAGTARAGRWRLSHPGLASGRKRSLFRIATAIPPGVTFAMSPGFLSACGRSSRRFAKHRLSAEPAAPRINGNLAQALGTLLDRRIGRRWRLTHARDQGVDRREYEEIHRGRHQYERHHGVDEVAHRKRGAVDGEADGREIRLADQRRDERCQQIFGEGGYDRPEGRADDHAYRQVNHVATKNELLESAEHGVEPPKCKAANLRRQRRLVKQ